MPSARSASRCRSSDWEPSAFETRAEPMSMCRKRPFARAPLDERRRVSYPVSDSLSRIRRAAVVVVLITAAVGYTWSGIFGLIAPSVCRLVF